MRKSRSISLQLWISRPIIWQRFFRIPAAHKHPYHITHCDTYALKHGSYLTGAARVTSANRMCTIKRSVTTRATCHLIINRISDWTRIRHCNMSYICRQNGLLWSWKCMHDTREQKSSLYDTLIAVNTTRIKRNFWNELSAWENTSKVTTYILPASVFIKRNIWHRTPVNTVQIHARDCGKTEWSEVNKHDRNAGEISCLDRLLLQQTEQNNQKSDPLETVPTVSGTITVVLILFVTHCKIPANTEYT